MVDIAAHVSVCNAVSVAVCFAVCFAVCVAVCVAASRDGGYCGARICHLQHINLVMTLLQTWSICGDTHATELLYVTLIEYMP